MIARNTTLTSLLATLLAFVIASPVRAGQPDPEGDFPKTGLVFWVSAEQVEVGADNVVKSMKDRSGNDNPAMHLGAGNDQKQPKLDKDPVSGLPVLSFSGSITGLGFNRISDIRTTFWVLSKDPSRDGNCEERTAFGDSKYNDFHVGCRPDTIFNINTDPGNTSPLVAQGKTYLNGALVDPTTTHYPAKLGLVSVVTTGNCRANQIGKDRDIGRSWIGSIAELLVYNVALSDVDRAAVEQYFIGKYGLDGKPPVKRDGGVDAGMDGSGVGDACCGSETGSTGGAGGSGTTALPGSGGAGGSTARIGNSGGASGASSTATGGKAGQMGNGTSRGSGGSDQHAAASSTSSGCSCSVVVDGARLRPAVLVAILAGLVLRRRRKS